MGRQSFAIASLLTAFGLAGRYIPQDRQILNGAEPVLEVAVVGDYSKRASSAYTKWEGANSQATVDYYAGARAALQTEVRKQPDSGAYFRITPIDDGANEAQAIDLARQLMANPNILAVIGHTTSAQTRKTASIYAKARIPLILPVATAQAAVYPDGLDENLFGRNRRLLNCYRLPPSDDNAQAPAIAYLVTQLQPRRVHIIEETADGGAVYSKPLGNSVRTFLQIARMSDVQTPREVSDSSVEDTVDTICRGANGDDVVVYCGYSKQAKAFLAALAKRQAPGKAAPRIILSEGCQDLDEDRSSGLPFLRMSPSDISRCDNDSEGMKALRAIAGADVVSANMVFGYDAARILIEALKGCDEKGIGWSRACVLDQLQTRPAFPSLCGGYSFHDGESLVSSYFVYKSAGFDGKALPKGLGEPSAGGYYEIPARRIVQVGAQAKGNHQ
ncbi:MAG TPA: ABC transporter substrate-binding protein [Paludibaculum sp.]|jgi:ABC-type branched-subunit amino acid transport system substrate-binding protein